MLYIHSYIKPTSFVRRFTSSVINTSSLPQTGVKLSVEKHIALRALFKSYLAAEIGIINGKAAVYKSGSLIVREHFEYRERLLASEHVVELFHTRQRKRSEQAVKVDKSINPLIAIPAAPGSGKSTFLVHFPHSTCYQEYCKKIPAIVAPLSFNGAMTMCHIDTVTGKHLHTFGLRILFGAAMAMQSAESKKLQPEDDPFRWHNFLNLFETFASLSALDAVVILREVYGDNRRVLVLVDELSKIARHDQADDAVVGEIGHILDSLDYADVIVSSLSPQYAEALLTGSGRSVLHVMLESLIKYGLGHEECMDWANRLLSQLGKSEIEVDKFAIRFLQSIDLLLSGHPRSLEHLVSRFANDSAWNSTINTLRFTESKVHFPTMLRSVLMDLLASRSILRPKGLDLAVLEESLNFFVKETSDYRFLLERGSVLVIPQSKFTSSFRTTISLLSFFSLVGDFKLQDRGLDPRVFAASVLFGDVFRSNKTSIGQLFEHAVALTVVCYSHVTKLDLLTAGAWLGCPYYMNNRLPLVPPGLTTRIARTIEDMLIPAGGPQTNELVVAFDNCPGFDSVVTLMASEDSPAHTIYLEQKVSAVQDPNTMRISKLVSALQFHYLCTRAMKKDAQLDSFKHMHMLFYEWGADSADTPTVSKAAVIAAVSSYFAELERTAEPRAATKGKSFRSKPQGLQYDSLLLSMSKSKTHLRRMRNCFDAYLSADGDAVTVRARVIGRSDLEEWLVPPMAPIPLLVESVLASDVTKTSE